MTDPDRLSLALAAAQEFVRTEAGFAQLSTLDRAGYPTARTASAFLAPDWSAELVQRSAHRRLAQLRRDPRILITWSGPPAVQSRNEHPAVFDLGLEIPRVVFLQGSVEFLDATQTWDVYSRHDRCLRARGLTRAPERDQADVAATLVGLRVRPRRVRLEGFGAEAEAFSWTIPATIPATIARGHPIAGHPHTRVGPSAAVKEQTMLKTILGYDIVEGVSPQEYEAWLFDVHAPDLLANPHIDRIVFNKVLRPVSSTSGGAAKVPPSESFYRIAEMHFADEDAYGRYLSWFEEHPLDPSRGPGGRTDFKFYLVTESTEVSRESR